MPFILFASLRPGTRLFSSEYNIHVVVSFFKNHFTSWYRWRADPSRGTSRKRSLAATEAGLRSKACVSAKLLATRLGARLNMVAWRRG